MLWIKLIISCPEKAVNCQLARKPSLFRGARNASCQGESCKMAENRGGTAGFAGARSTGGAFLPERRSRALRPGSGCFRPRASAADQMHQRLRADAKEKDEPQSHGIQLLQLQPGHLPKIFMAPFCHRSCPINRTNLGNADYFLKIPGKRPSGRKTAGAPGQTPCSARRLRLCFSILPAGRGCGYRPSPSRRTLR